MADKNRHGELIYSEVGKFRDLENGAKGYHALTKTMLDVPQSEELSELKVIKDLIMIQAEAAKNAAKAGT